MKRPADPEVPALDELDLLNGVLEHRVRLAACVLLSRHDAMSFTGLKQVLGETDGSLGAHLRKLEKSGYLAVEKTYRDRRPVTWYRLSESGRASLKRHLSVLTRLIDQAA
ncbi:MAG: helix-turn-helix domain-containing protein [Acidobacteriia bacterium]|nr:helix-turn-helix domain-containing protein [Terriglobia bacterium]MYG01940.1 helix-turn-helix domain-containing protein [Terriglobia bacterium]MYK11736.1 helix-turn-helix domain-containing protein [Terriglobia bacterium]